MQAIRILIPVFLLFAVAAPVQAEDAPIKPMKPKLEYLYLTVTGAKTDAVAADAQRKVAAVKGVQSFEWTAPRIEVKVVRVVGQAPTPTLVAAFQQAGVSAAGLPVNQTALVFKKKLHCNGCVVKVKRALKAIKGTKEVHVAKDMTGVTIVYDTKTASVAQFQKAVAGVGYPTK